MPDQYDLKCVLLWLLIMPETFARVGIRQRNYQPDPACTRGSLNQNQTRFRSHPRCSPRRLRSRLKRVRGRSQGENRQDRLYRSLISYPAEWGLECRPMSVIITIGICWLGLNGALVAVLATRSSRPGLRARLFNWVVRNRHSGAGMVRFRGDQPISSLPTSRLG